jgi:putative transposase
VAKQRKVYRFRMRPTRTQTHALNRMAGARRYVWNWGLRRRQEHYKTTGKTLPLMTLMAELTALKRQPGMQWLFDVDSQALQQVLKDLYRAYDNHFNPKMKARLPKFKSRKRDRARFRIPQRVQLDAGKVYVPKIGFVRIRQSQPVAEPTKSATFKRDARGHWFITLVVEFEMPEVTLPPPDPAKVVGIDLGLIDFATTSDGAEPIPAPKFYRKAERKIRKAARTFSRRQKGSKRKAKARIKLARAQQKAAQQRKDFLHKTTTKLVHGHDGICIEDLGVKALARTKLSKSFHDAALGEFRRQLAYKCLWYHKHLVPIDRYFPSSKLCNRCGVVNQGLTLDDREWTCPCGAHHKRDFLAACNIRDEGLRILAAGQAGESKRSGRDCRSRHAGLVSSN